MTLFEKLIICHFVGDWLFQNQYIADRKTKDHAIRAMHCAIYTACFCWLGFWPCVYIFATHFAIDTYLPLYWFRKLRGDYKSLEEFKESFKTPAGFMVNATMDQIFHLLTFVPLLFLK